MRNLGNFLGNFLGLKGKTLSIYGPPEAL